MRGYYIGFGEPVDSMVPSAAWSRQREPGVSRSLWLLTTEEDQSPQLILKATLYTKRDTLLVYPDRIELCGLTIWRKIAQPPTVRWDDEGEWDRGTHFYPIDEQTHYALRDWILYDFRFLTATTPKSRKRGAEPVEEEDQDQ